MTQTYEDFINEIKEVLHNQPIPPHYNPDEWKEKNFNCYAYAMRICMDLSDYPSCICPGFISKGQENDLEETKESILEHFMEDCKCLGLKVLSTTMSAKIQKNEYKIAVYVKKGVDFHFARQDSNGKWSEKNGWGRAIETLDKKDVTKYQDGYKFIGIYRVSKK